MTIESPVQLALSGAVQIALDEYEGMDMDRAAISELGADLLYDNPMSDDTSVLGAPRGGRSSVQILRLRSGEVHSPLSFWRRSDSYGLLPR